MNGVPQGITDAALHEDSGQWVDLSKATVPSYLDACTPLGDNDESLPVPQFPLSDQTSRAHCENFIGTMRDVIGRAGTDGTLAAMGSTDPAADADRLKEKITEEGNGRLRHWRCAKRAATDVDGATVTAHRCEYIVRAHRINVYPDNVELVWFDSVHDTDTTALPLWIVSKETAPDQLSRLCSAGRPFPRLNRAFGSSNQGYAEINPDCAAGCGLSCDEYLVGQAISFAWNGVKSTVSGAVRLGLSLF